MLDKINKKIAELDADIQYHKEELKKAEDKKALWEELKADEVEDLTEASEEAEEADGCDNENSDCEKEEVVVRGISYAPVD